MKKNDEITKLKNELGKVKRDRDVLILIMRDLYNNPNMWEGGRQIIDLTLEIIGDEYHDDN